MKRRSRLAKSNAKELLKNLGTDQRGTRSNQAVVTVDPFVGNKRGKISDYYQRVDNQSQSGSGRYSCRWQLRIGQHGLCKHMSDAFTGVIEHIMGNHASFGTKGFTCNWAGCAKKRSSIFHSKTEFVTHLRQHDEDAQTVETESAHSCSSDESYDESSGDGSEDTDSDGEDKDEFNPNIGKKRRVTSQNKSLSKAKQPRRCTLPPKLVGGQEKPRLQKTPASTSTSTRAKSVDGKRDIQSMTVTLFRFTCLWEVTFPKKSGVPLTVTCSRKFSVHEESIEHLHGHHLGKVRGMDGPYKCCWKDCAQKEEDFETIEELEKHVVTHTEEKLITLARSPSGDRSVQKMTPVAAPTNKPAQVSNPNPTKPKPKEEEKVSKIGNLPKSTKIDHEEEENKSSSDTGSDASDVNIEPEVEENTDFQTPTAPIASVEDVKPETKVERDFETFVSRRFASGKEQSCINSVLQALLTTSLPTIVKKLCSSGHRCYFCRMLSFTQRAIHNSNRKPIKPFELSLYKEELGITDGEGDPTEYVHNLVGEIIADENAQHHSNDTKYRFMIRFQKKTCNCSMSYEAYHWALSPMKKNESLFDLMGKCKTHCDQCKVVTSVQSIQMPDNLIITFDRSENVTDTNVYYPDEWVSYNTRYFLSAVIVDDPRSSGGSEPHYYTYCKVFGNWMMYDDDKTTKASSCDALGNKRVRVLVYVGNELTPHALQEAMLQARSYSAARHLDTKIKLEPPHH